jgi:UPF0755 protein
MNDIVPPNRLRPQVPQRPAGPQPLGVPPRQRPQTQPLQPLPPALDQPTQHAAGMALPPATQIDTPLNPERPKRRWIKRLFIVFTVIFVLVAAAGVAGFFWYKDAMNAKSGSEERIKVQVEQGAAAGDVAAMLEQKGVVKSALALQIYMRTHNKGDIKAGQYMFSPNQTPFEIVEWLIEGKVDTFKLTILPGKALSEIKKSLQDYGYTADAIDAAFGAKYEHPLLADKPAGTTLEGYSFPDTYQVSAGTPLEQVITQSFDLFEQKIKQDNLKSVLSSKGFNMYQAITLASIIELEVHGEQDQRQVSQVFQLRLQQGAPLGSDVTYKYGAALLGVEPTAQLDSPYNTRIRTGLPPGPIANFNIGALKAVASPAPGDYLYFVSGDDGINRFSRTFQEHEQNIRQYCQKLCAVY